MNEEYKRKSKERRDKIQKIIEENKGRLLSCPFCGDKPILLNGGTPSNPEFKIECTCWNHFEHSYYNNLATPKFRDIELTIEIWNKRKPIAPDNKTKEPVANEQGVQR
ncbi:MAG: hypothetical protein PHE17_18230 [Thiothrix sp.]|uniref:hypothetical protein n=1 Tax=Thiothrix sp. TaxID=1032 RepID=UPI00263871DA|nr:hypothetical protein [Thiothrix sp.]MDD5394960.1 hypothetical protein [Thiothrix sp.]